jgi:NitT/TauT family transport system substrate-binding protein
MRRGAVIVLALVVLAGCGGEEDAAPTREQPTTVTVGVLPIADMAPLYLGIEKGFFREQGLEVETQVAQGGAAIVPAVVSGDFQFGFGNNVSLMIARAKGLPLKIVTEGVQGAPDEESWANGLLVAEDSPIRSVEDLAGRTFAVTTLKNNAEVTIKATLEKAGVDVSDLKFVEVPFPEMNTAVARGRADVAWQAEPFVTIGEQQGMRNIVDPMWATAPNLSIATYFGAEPYLAENPEVAKGFAAAMRRSLDYAADHPDEARAIIPTYSEIKGELLEQIQLANWSSELNVSSIEQTAELARKYGVLEEDLDLQALLP